MWDPATVADLPWDDSTGLPRSLTPPSEALSSPDGKPALAVVDTGIALALWDASGSWHGLAYPEQPMDGGGRSALSPDGALIAFVGRTALWSASTADGDWQSVDYPDGFHTSGEWGAGMVVGSDAAVILDELYKQWHVDLDTGRATRLGHDYHSMAAAPDSAYVGLTFEENSRNRTIEEYDGPTVTSRVDSRPLQPEPPDRK